MLLAGWSNGRSGCLRALCIRADGQMMASAGPLRCMSQSRFAAFVQWRGAADENRFPASALTVEKPKP